MMTRRQAYQRLSLIHLIFFLLSLTHSIWLPLHEAPDEVAHFLHARFIAENGRLPLDYEERQAAGYRSDWPALYHIVVAAVTGWSSSEEPPYLKFVWESPRFELARQLLNTKRLANTEDEFMPYQGIVLMWHLGRLVSIGLSMGTILVTFFIALEIFPRNYWLALVSASIIAFVPTFIFISSSLSDDTLTGLLLGLYFWALIKIVKGDTRVSNYVLLGLFMGLAATTKYSNVLLPVEVIGVLAFLAWRNTWGWLVWLKRLILTAVFAIIASSWWYLTLIIYFNEIDKYGWLIGSLKPILAGGIDTSQRYMAFILTGGTIGIQDSPEFISEPFWQWGLQIWQSFWVRQIGNYPLGLVAQIIAGLVCIISIISLVKVWRHQSKPRVWIALFVFHVLLFLILPALRHAIQGNVSQTAQGRHVLFPVATVLPLLIIYGWQGWFSLKTQRLFALAIVGGLLCWSLVQLIRVVDYPILYLPIRTTAEAASGIPHRVDQTFGDHLILLGYDLETAPEENALKIKLYWQTSDYVDEDYLMTVALVQEGKSALSWTLYPLNGLYPTRIWESRETIRDDIWLPLVDLTPGEYQLQMHFQSVQGTLLPVGANNALTLNKIIVPAQVSTQSDILLTVFTADREVVEGITLWQADRFRRFDLPEYKPRMQIPFVWQGQPGPSERVEWLLVDPDGGVYPSTSLSDHFESFMVGLDWPSGDYRLRVEVWLDDTVISSKESEPLVRIINKKPRILEPPPITYPLKANFANQVELLGYDLPTRSLSSGQGVPVTLYWQGLRTMGRSYTVFAKLLDNQQQVWGSADRLPADGYDTIYWLENEVIIDGFELPVDPAIPDGVYWLNVGLYEAINQAAVSLPLVVDDERSDVTSVTFGPVKIGGPPPGVVTQNASPNQPLAVDLGEVIRLRGYDLTQNDMDFDLTLYWESLLPTPVDYTVFVHVHNQAGETVAQLDRPPLDGAYPTSLWDSGELIPDHLLVPWPQELPAGDYAVVVGLYDFATGTRLPVSNSPDDSVVLAKIVIP